MPFRSPDAKKAYMREYMREYMRNKKGDADFVMKQREYDRRSKMNRRVNCNINCTLCS
jgi:ribosomal protein L44E